MLQHSLKLYIHLHPVDVGADSIDRSAYFTIRPFVLFMQLYRLVWADFSW